MSELCPLVAVRSPRSSGVLFPQSEKGFLAKETERSETSVVVFVHAAPLARSEIHLCNNEEGPVTPPTHTHTHTGTSIGSNWSLSVGGLSTDKGVWDSLGVGGSASDAQALYNVVSTMAGTGVLQLPFAVSQSGWAGVALLILISLMCNYTGEIMHGPQTHQQGLQSLFLKSDVTVVCSKNPD